METDKIKSLLSYLTASVDKYQALLTALDAEMRLLNTAGISDGVPFWREGKYLYLNHPTKDGKKPREYIGKDPEKIKEALESVNRYKRWDEARRKREKVLTDLMGLEAQLTYASQCFTAGRTH